MFDRQGNTRNSNNSGNSEWKADGFINAFLPRRDGTRMKLGFFALKLNNQDQKQLMQWLQEDESHLEILKNKLVLEFKAVAEESAGLDLDFTPPAPPAQP